MDIVLWQKIINYCSSRLRLSNNTVAGMTWLMKCPQKDYHFSRRLDISYDVIVYIYYFHVWPANGTFYVLPVQRLKKNTRMAFICIILCHFTHIRRVSHKSIIGPRSAHRQYYYVKSIFGPTARDGDWRGTVGIDLIGHVSVHAYTN